MKQLPDTICKQIDHALLKYPDDQRQAAVIYALILVQKAHAGWLDQQAMDLVAEYLNMPKIAVYEVASFYSLLDLQPVGRHKISVCTNISCMLRGSDQVVEHLCQKLKINLGETTSDGKFTMRAVECLAACGGAPMMQIDEDYHENLTNAKIDQILAGLE